MLLRLQRHFGRLEKAEAKRCAVRPVVISYNFRSDRSIQDKCCICFYKGASQLLVGRCNLVGGIIFLEII